MALKYCLPSALYKDKLREYFDWDASGNIAYANRPRLLDMFCGAGGASFGYYLSGFQVVGVDHAPQSRYPFQFIQGDALEYVASHGHEYDAIAASPPCQSYSALKHMARGESPALVEITRLLLQATGRPYVIENVVGAPLRWPLMLCGSMFGLQTSCGAQLRRHRLFESNVLLMSPGHCRHGETISVCGDTPHNPRTWRATHRGLKAPMISVNGHEFRNEASRHAERRTISIHGNKADDPRREGEVERQRAARTMTVVGATPRDPSLEKQKYGTVTVTGSTPQRNVVRNTIRETFSVEEARIAMGIDWMPMRSLSQAIPPAYTEFIGRQIRNFL